MHDLTATYSPEDNKLRLYSVRPKLDEATYQRVRAAGFIFAPKQDLFVAPAWTPTREDLLMDLCGEIGDEDTSLVERAESRADRFDEYSGNRAAEAQSARAAVSAIADHIPFGQPILVGHHSEARARKDAERIENGMRKAVNLWDTAQYWKQRAAGALRHAKHKERPDVRARRIKTLEADKRKEERSREEAAFFLEWWSKEGLTQEQALALASRCHLRMPRKEGDRPDWDMGPSAYDALTNSHPNLYAPRTLDEIVALAKQRYPATIAWCDRWIKHYENRIQYERAMLEEQGGLAGEKVDMQPGGRVLCGETWLTIVRVNKRDGRTVSVTTNGRYGRVKAVEEVQQYEPPTEASAAAVAAALAKAPTANYSGAGFGTVTKAEYSKIPSDYKGFATIPASDAHGAHRVKRALASFVPAGQRNGHASHSWINLHITDEKRKDPPAASAAAAPAQELPAPEPVASPVRASAPTASTAPTPAAPSADFDALRDRLRDGVQVVSAPQLFPTPDDLAQRMIDTLDLIDGARVLEPSAGTGQLVRALRATGKSMHIVAVEINGQLADSLRRNFANDGQPVPQEVEVIGRDFLEPLAVGRFDAIAMNPPFAQGQDIEHIRKAIDLLGEGGRLVAICADGSRQNAELRPLIERAGGTWEKLPAGTFKESGTGVHTVLLTYQKR